MEVHRIPFLIASNDIASRWQIYRKQPTPACQQLPPIHKGAPQLPTGLSRGDGICQLKKLSIHLEIKRHVIVPGT